MTWISARAVASLTDPDWAARAPDVAPVAVARAWTSAAALPEVVFSVTSFEVPPARLPIVLHARPPLMSTPGLLANVKPAGRRTQTLVPARALVPMFDTCACSLTDELVSA